MISPQPLCRQLSRETVARVVHHFYRKVLVSPELAGYFSHIEDWPLHESRITDFWWGVMGGKVESPRPRAMEQGHRDLQFGPAELDIWLSLFVQSLKECLPENIAQKWSEVARIIGKHMAERGIGRANDWKPSQN